MCRLTQAQAQAQAGAMDVGQIIGKIRDIPRAAAITEGQKRKPGARPPGSARVDQQDYDVIQVSRRLPRTWLHRFTA